MNTGRVSVNSSNVNFKIKVCNINFYFKYHFLLKRGYQNIRRTAKGSV